MNFVRAFQDGAFKKCCMRSGGYDGSRHNYFFPRLKTVNSARGHSCPVRSVPIGKCMYLRFVVTDIDEDSERALGVFHAVRYIRDAGRLYTYEEDQHDMIRWWFNENLERPTRFTASKAPFYRKKSR